MRLQVLVGAITAFVIVGMLVFLGINWMSSVPAPTNTTSNEYAVYTNLSDTVDIANTANEGVLILLVVVIVVVALVILFGFATKRF